MQGLYQTKASGYEYVCIGFYMILKYSVANNPQRQTQLKHYKPSSPVTEVPHKQWLDVWIV